MLWVFGGLYLFLCIASPNPGQSPVAVLVRSNCFALFLDTLTYLDCCA